MLEKIQQLLSDCETHHGIDILYACESGSRAWGFASPDSDYDIRFIYRRPIKDVYQITSVSDTIEIPIKDDLDPGGWELRKALSLLTSSNGALLEWLHSPIIYRANEAFLSEIRALAQESLSPVTLANHYRGMAQKVLKTGLSKNKPTGKSYLYGLRASLAAHYVLKTGRYAPVVFSELLSLLDSPERAVVDDLLSWKETAGEKDSPGRLPIIDQYLENSQVNIVEACASLSPRPSPLDALNALLHRWTLWP